MDVWNQLNVHEHAFAFRKPVNRKRAPNYDQIIKRPIDLSTMKRRINSQKITTVAQFMSTMQLLRDNAALYNGESSTYTYSAQVLIDFSKELFAAANVDYTIEPASTNTRRSKRKRGEGSQPNSRNPSPLDPAMGAAAMNAAALDSDEDVVIAAVINGGRRSGRMSKATSKALEARRATRGRRKNTDPPPDDDNVPLISIPKPAPTVATKGVRGRRKRGRQSKSGVVK